MARFLARFVAAILAIAFVAVTVAVVFFHAAGTRMLRADLYKEALVSQGIYDKLPSLSGEMIRTVALAHEGEPSDAAPAEKDPLSRSLSELAPGEWETLLGAMLPQDRFRSEVERALDDGFAFLHGGRSRETARFSLAEMKRRMAGPEAEAAYLRVLEGKPVCTMDEFEAAGGLPVRCRPAPEQMARAMEHFRALMRALADTLPDEIDPLSDLRNLEGIEEGSSVLDEVRARVRMIEWAAPLSPGVPVLLALLIALFAVRSLRGLLLWWGVPCFVAGLIALLAAAPLAFMGSGIFKALALAQIPAEVPLATVEAVWGFVSAVVRQVMAPAMCTSAVLAGGGLAAMILAALVRKRPAPTPAFRG
jgi:hypothetical protein